jgi:hypothetical protein
LLIFNLVIKIKTSVSNRLVSPQISLKKLKKKIDTLPENFLVKIIAAHNTSPWDTFYLFGNLNQSNLNFILLVGKSF